MILQKHPDDYPEVRGMKALGYWVNDHHPDLPDPKDFVDFDWDPSEKALVIGYLENGKLAMGWRGWSICRICGIRNGSVCLADGDYVWPEGFAHYLKEHGVRPPAEFVEHVARKAVRQFQADLNPPLGKPGGPCHVVRRIEKEVRNPQLKDQLVDKVEEGASLSNPEAAKVYDLEAERAKGLVTKFIVGPHTQYRMDLRKVSVKDLQRAFEEWSKETHVLRKSGNPEYEALRDKLNQGDKIKYTSPQNLTVVFAGESKGIVKVISTWWQGVPDPPPPGTCEVQAMYSYDRREARAIGGIGDNDLAPTIVALAKGQDEVDKAVGTLRYFMDALKTETRIPDRDKRGFLEELEIQLSILRFSRLGQVQEELARQIMPKIRSYLR